MEIRKLRRVYAMVFLFFLLCHAGDHFLLEFHSHNEPHHFSSLVGEHAEADHEEEVCDSISTCSEHPNDDDQPTNIQDENNHHHLLIATVAYNFRKLRQSTKRFSARKPAGYARSEAPPDLPPKHS